MRWAITRNIMGYLSKTKKRAESDIMKQEDVGLAVRAMPMSTTM